MHYTLVDEQPIFSINYYRLELGGVGSSEVISIEVLNFGEQGYVIRPNPFVTETKIQFQNESNETFRLMVYGVDGKKIMEEESQNNYFSITSSDLKGGLYVFVLNKKDGSYSRKGKILRLN